MAVMQTFSCQYCLDDFSAPSEPLLLSHIRLVHSHEPGFSIQCTVNGCCRTFKNFRTFQNHRSQKHHVSPPNDVERHEELEEELDLSSSTADIDLANNEESSIETSDIQSYAVRWILKTRETRGLSRAAMDGIVDDVQELVEHVTHSLRDKTNHVLQSKNLDEQTLSAVNNVFKSPITEPFDGVSSFHQQLQYCRRHLDFVVWDLNVITFE